MEPLEVLFNLLEPVVDHHLDPPGSAHQDLSNNLGLVDLEEDLEVLRMDHRLEAHLALVVLASMDRLEVEVDVAEEGGEEEGDQMVLSGVDLTWDSEDEVDLEEEGVASEDPQVLKLKKLIQKRKISSFPIQIARSIFFTLISYVSGHWNDGPMDGGTSFGGPPGFGGNEGGFDNFDE